MQYMRIMKFMFYKLALILTIVSATCKGISFVNVYCRKNRVIEYIFQRKYYYLEYIKHFFFNKFHKQPTFSTKTLPWWENKSWRFVQNYIYNEKNGTKQENHTRNKIFGKEVLNQYANPEHKQLWKVTKSRN